MLLSLLFLLGWSQASAPASLVNPAQTAQAPSKTPGAWTSPTGSIEAGHRVEGLPGGRSPSAGRLRRVQVPEGKAAVGGIARQILDASPYRGKRVRYSVRLRVAKPGDEMAIAFASVGPTPKPAGFAERLPIRPAVGQWETHSIIGRVSAAAERVNISVMVRGDADVAIEDAALTLVEPDPRPPSAQARAYLAEAIKIIRENHIDSRGADWRRITANANADIGGAVTSADTYLAIRGVLGELGEKHSFFLPLTPPAAAAQSGASATPPPAAQPLPFSQLVDGKFGLVALPALSPLGPGNFADHSRAYTRTLREALEGFDRQPICGWIVDLRGNGGGNMWPMLQGLDPLLGAAPFGSFVESAGKIQYWQRRKGEIIPDPEKPTAEAPSYRLSKAALPLAVLVGPRTGSSGEMVAIALAGREGARFFGQPTAGYSTANRPFPLSDGARLIITGSFARDRTGRQYLDVVTPDVEAADAEAEAVKWLGSQPCPQASSSTSQ